MSVDAVAHTFTAYPHATVAPQQTKKDIESNKRVSGPRAMTRDAETPRRQRTCFMSTSCISGNSVMTLSKSARLSTWPVGLSRDLCEMTYYKESRSNVLGHD